MPMKLKVSHVFEHNVKTFLNNDFTFCNGKKLLIHEGSARSGKTWSILQFFRLLAVNNTGLEIVLARDTRKNAKDTIWKDFLKICSDFGGEYSVNKTDLKITINSNVFEFIGLDDPHKGHGASQDIFYVNEVMGVKEESFKQRLIRTSLFCIVDYNPSEDHHYIYNYKEREDTEYYKSALFKEVQGLDIENHSKYEIIDYDQNTDTYILLLNPFAPINQVNEIYLTRPCEKHDKQGTSSTWHWQVYGLGNKAAKEGLIFSNWSIIDNYDDIIGEEVYYGLDFGVVHPTALVEVKRIGKSLYVRELIYHSDIKIAQIIEMIKSKVPAHAEITADSAGLVQIQEIYSEGINVHSCKKTKDFKNTKIKQYQGYKIYIDENSKNFISEISSWMWRKDRLGNTLPEPVKIKDDAMDAFIYAGENMTDKKHVPQFKIYTS
jgi:PBSX family phage terminase large subunit